MKYATAISEIINAFSPEPLKESQMAQFYCDKTMEYRMSDKYSSPIQDICEACQMPMDRNAFLLLGHKGCGKSTELNNMSAELYKNGYKIKTIQCSMDLDLFNIMYSDLFILIGDALFEIAEEINCKIDKKLLNNIKKFWSDDITKVSTMTELAATSIETESSAKTPDFLSGLIHIFAKIKTDLKFNEETRTEYRTKIRTRSSEWIQMLEQLATLITEQLDGKQPIIIFEDLDKLNPEDAWNVFYNYAAILSGLSFPIIYTFPIGLSYDPRFSALEGYFIPKTLPMIKIQTIDGQKYIEGINIIKEIVKKRAKLELFEKDVLDSLIQYTGGSLRDLFYTINVAAKRAERRKSSTISEEDAQKALEELKTSLTRRIEKSDYKFLSNIYTGNKEVIEDKQMLLKFLQASVVLEYNGKRWHNVHPLVIRFLKSQGLIENEEE